MEKLKFGKGNAKLDGFKEPIYTFSLPAGYTCPGASLCKSQAIVDSNGKRSIKDGKDCQFRCFAASQEVVYTNTYNARRHNLNLLRRVKTVAGKARLIARSLPRKARYVRIHVSGDFYSQGYFDAWCQTARDNPAIIFYAYTKSIPFWVSRLGDIPSNLILTASIGGKFDSEALAHGLRNARVVYSESEAESLGLPIDHDDSHAIKPGGDFALLIHGVQPARSKASKAKEALGGKGSYGKGKKLV